MTRAIATKYLDQGLTPIPVNHGSKKPAVSEWQNHVPDVANDFPDGLKRNVGIVLGDASKGLVDIDLDCDEAIRMAQMFLPQTGMIFGRHSRLQSHWLYLVPECGSGARFGDDAGTLVECRANGQQTVFPPSVHSSGETIAFHSEDTPVAIDREKLFFSVKRLAADSLLARNWNSGKLVLSRFSSGYLIASLAIKETDHGTTIR